MANRLTLAGKELLKGNFGNAMKSLVESSYHDPLDLTPSTYRGDQMWFFGSDGVEHPFTYGNRQSPIKAYRKCPPLAAIINRKAQARMNGKLWILNSRGKESDSLPAKKIKTLLMRPNPLQTWRQFKAQSYIYQQLFGFSIWLPLIPTGFKQYGPIEATSLWNIPPFMLDIEEYDSLYYQTGGKIIKRITLNYRNKRIDIDPESVFIIKDFVPSFESLVIPDSRIIPLEMPINNIIGAMESENVIINRRGPDYMISSDTRDGVNGMVPLTPGEKDQLEKDFMQKYGLRKSQVRAIITSAAVKYTPMSFPVRDLMLHESVKENTKCICDGYNYPPHLLGLIDPTFNNQNAAEKGLYNNAIIPEADSDMEQINQAFRTEEYNLQIQEDFSHIPVLQEDARAEAAARRVKGQALDLEFKNNWITLNRVLELLGEDTVTWGDQYYYQLQAAGLMGQASLLVNPAGELTTSNSNDEKRAR